MNDTTAYTLVYSVPCSREQYREENAVNRDVLAALPNLLQLRTVRENGEDVFNMLERWKLRYVRKPYRAQLVVTYRVPDNLPADAELNVDRLRRTVENAVLNLLVHYGVGAHGQDNGFTKPE